MIHELYTYRIVEVISVLCVRDKDKATDRL